MIRAFHTSATGMTAQQAVLDNTANNLANLNTTGFKSSEIEFQDMLYSTLRQPGTQSANAIQVPTGTQIGNGVKIGGNTRLFTPGALNLTGNSLDLAIDGQGFFQIAAPDGSLHYTRDGSFRTNSTGQLVTSDGWLVQPSLTVPPDVTNINVGTDGTVSITTASNPSTSTTLGTLQVVRFANPAGLSAEGQNLYTPTAASGTANVFTAGTNGTGMVRSGFLENSNVNVVTELVNMISAQRAYEFNTKSIKVADEMLSDTTDLVR
jgi:flagellar basal-body rod protein FlgG